ncbi:MAG: alpha/beta hydrolase family protein [Planctomycetota bacterium]|jgi:dienelactone hydrolase
MEPRNDVFELAGADGEALRGHILRPAQADGPVPVVLIVHGFKGFRGWGFFPWWSEQVTGLGFAAVSVDLSHNGTGPDGEAYPRKDLFGRQTWARHQEDLRVLHGALHRGDLPGAEGLDTSRVGLLGHSLGGGLAVLHAADHPGAYRGVVGLAPTATPDRFREEQKAAWREKGELPIVNSRTGEVLPLGVDYLDDFESRREALDIPRRATSLTCPLLVIHGAEDTSVPCAEGRSIAEAVIASGRPARYVEIPGTQHTFDAVHPFAGETPALERTKKEVLAFLETYLVKFDPYAEGNV